MKKLLFLMALIFATTTISAQMVRVYGQVTESWGGPPMAGFKVSCEYFGVGSSWSNPINTMTTYTDSQGYYSFYVPIGNAIVYIDYIPNHPNHRRFNFPFTLYSGEEDHILNICFDDII